MSLTIRERTTTLYQFLIRLVGVVGEVASLEIINYRSHQVSGGVWTVAAFSLRVFNRAQREVTKVVSSEKDSTSTLPSVSPVPAHDRSSSHFGRGSPSGNSMPRSASWMSNRNGNGDMYGDWKGR